MSIPAPIPTPWYQILPRLGNDEEFDRARGLFAQTGYNAEQICKRVNVDSFDRYVLRFVPDVSENPIHDALDAMIRLFTDCLYVGESVLRSSLPEGAIETLQALNLLTRDDIRPDSLYAPSPIYPVGAILTVCDRGYSPSGVRCAPPRDTVYPAILDNTLKFVDWLPMEPCDSMLDLGTGTGIAALASTGAAKQIWASDITARSVHFAEFNRRLAGIGNITVVEGDLYAPVAGLTFDRIVTHPPYVPAKESKFIFREGGADGEQIIRAIIQGVPEYLRPRGRLFAMVLGSDREGESFEQRIRKWLGDRHEEFDVVVVSDSLKAPADYIAHAVGQNMTNPEEVQFWREMWIANKTEYLLHGTVLIQRHASAREPITIRTQAGPDCHGRDLTWRLNWEITIREPEGLKMLLEAKPVPSPGSQFRLVHRVRDGRFVPEVYKFDACSPFLTSAQCPEWMARTICSCDGNTTGMELFERLRASGSVTAEASPEQFARMLGALVANAILRVEQPS